MLFRNRRLVRAFACYLLLQLVSSLLYPTVSLAMMGPSQPEFTTYEAPGSTDMVNLSTGDFTYNLPVLDIPGPERGFSLPLTYKAGISLEQEASWVGLGWSLNPGAIARSVNGYADDANNEQVESTFYKKMDTGWQGGLPGVLDLGWNSISGYNGAVGLAGLVRYSWGGNSNALTIAGVTADSKKGISADPKQMALAAASLASMGLSASHAIARGSTESIGALMGAQFEGSVASSAAMGFMSGLGGGANMSGVVGFNTQPIREVSSHAFYDNYWDYYNNNVTENVFGSLYFGKMSKRAMAVPTSSTDWASAPPIYNSSHTPNLFRYQRDLGVTQSGPISKVNNISETAADIYQDGTDRTAVKGFNQLLSNNKYRTISKRPISIAHDYFSVMGEGVSGAIRPYRLEVGSIAYPKLGVDVGNTSAIYPKPEIHHYKYMVVPFVEGNKVDFRYENSLSNGYTYHKYNPAAGNDAVGFNANSYNGSLTITDPSLKDNARVESPRKGLTTSTDLSNADYPYETRLVQGKHVVWYSNDEIRKMYFNSTDGSANGFLEFEHPVNNSGLGYSNNNTFRRDAPPSGIGAFSVTAEDGTTYHYSLPVFQYQTYTEANEVWTSATIGGLGKSTLTVGRPGATDGVGYGSTNNPGAHATAWLLTAITSADYIDHNHSGTVDADDWGGWVKFEYGKFSSHYKWRQPYIGNSYADDTTFISNVGFTEGYKDTYYLNSIATRSHTALFVKSVRQDGRGHFQPGSTVPASSLRLDEIILLDNATLGKLRTQGAIAPAVPALTNATSSAFSGFSDGPMAGSGDTMDNVLDTHDLDADARIRQFVEANALKRIHFNYDYDLCRGMPNSFSCTSGVPSSLPPMGELNMSTNRGGKLTLKSVSFFGPTTNGQVTKITPDFVFGYGDGQNACATNPAYGKEKWDAFGMYLPSGDYGVLSHKPIRGGYAAPWTLTQITSPLGGKTTIAYERDEYAHVSEFGTTKVHLSQANNSPTFTVSNTSGLGGPLISVLKVGQTVYLNGYNRQYFGNPVSKWITEKALEQPAVVSAITGSQVTLITANTINTGAYTGQVGEYDIVVPNNIPGGDIRVAAITTTEGTASYQVRYKYTTSSSSPADSWFNSSGVLAQEPAFLNRFEHAIYGTNDYPNAPVLYSQVTVLRGLFRNNAEDDYEKREVYSFYTPTTSMVQEVSPNWHYTSTPDPKLGIVMADNQTTVDVGKMGQPRKIEIYNHRGDQEIATSFDYASTVQNADGMPSQGHYTEGVLNNERVEDEYRINRSTKEYVPTIMVGSRTVHNGLAAASNNLLFDYFSGQVLESASTNSAGKVYHSRTIPAYTLPGNAGMGARGNDPANRNMLIQSGTSYSFVEAVGGPPFNPATSRILSAGVQTWNSTWTNYREADASGSYQDVAGQVPVWRQAAAYTWQSPYLNPDGSYKDFTPFNWNGSSSAYWLKAGETTRYDHYSHPLEARDLNGHYAAQKMGYNQSQLVVAAGNARFTEVAYSGAEDQITVAGSTHFGSEVIAGSGTPVAAPAPVHTGFYSLQVPGGETGFRYRARAGQNASQDVSVGKTYRLSVWANTNAVNGKLYVALNGTRLAEGGITSANTKKAGAWYLVSLLVTIPPAADGQLLEFGCANDGATNANFDDFRVAPLTATVTSKVYDPRTNHLLYSLDNDNLFTHYEYTATGRLKKVYQETLDQTAASSSPQKLLKEYDYNYALLTTPSWITGSYQCQVDAQGNNTGQEEGQLVNVNPLSPSPATGQWQVISCSPACIRPACYNEWRQPRVLRNNVCEEAQLTDYTCEPCEHRYGPVQTRMHFWWRFSDGTITDTYSDCQEGDCETGPNRWASKVPQLAKLLREKASPRPTNSTSHSTSLKNPN